MSKHSISETIEKQVSILTSLEEKSWEIAKDHLQWGTPTLQEAIGSWDEGVMFLLGASNGGKTSWSLQMIVNLLEYNEDVAILDVCLDDSFQERYRRYLSLFSKVPTQKVARPVACSSNELTKRTQAFEKLKTILLEGRLEIRSQLEDGFQDVQSLAKGIREFAENRPNKKLVLLLDAWHDLSPTGFEGSDPEKEMFRLLNQTLKDVGMICITSAHKRKSMNKNLSARNTNEDLKGTGALMYGSKIILSIYNDLKTRREKADLVWNNPTTQVNMPIIEVSVQKSKVSSFDDNIYYYFNPSTGNCKEVEDSISAKCKHLVAKSIENEYKFRGNF